MSSAPQQPDPVTSAMLLAAQNPNATEKAATAAVSAAHGAERAGGGDMKTGAKVMAGAAVVAGTTVGVVAGSTLLGLAAAGGAAYATTRSDKIGDAAKASGTAAVVLGGKAAEVNRQHHITERIGHATKKTFSAAKRARVNEEHLSPWQDRSCLLPRASVTRASTPPLCSQTSTRSTT